MASDSHFLHDLPATEDVFGREHFAKNLAHSLVLSIGSPGLVVGIEGEWGSGKSTLIGLIKKNIEISEEGKKTIVIDFNPWMVSTTGALVEALIGQIAASIGKKVTRGQKGINASQKLINYVSLLKSLKYIPGLSSVGCAAEDAAKAGQETLNDIKKLLPGLDLTQKKKEVIEALNEFKHSIIVIVDDLDRLPAEEIRSTMQAIKAVADFPQITYLLAYDPTIIARALADNEKSGLSYLEKIVQVAYPLPPLSQRQLKRFAAGKIYKLLQRSGITLRKYEEDRYEEAIVLMTKLSRHPRDVIRITNRLYLSLPATHNEVNAADVIVFEALSQRFPEICRAILKHSADFTGQFYKNDLIHEQDAIDWGIFMGSNKDRTEQAWVKHLPKEDVFDHQILTRSCLFLFEKNSEDNDAKFEDHLRIAAPNRLARLFNLTSIEEVPEVRDIHKLLSDPSELEKEINNQNYEEKLSLLNWLITYAPSCDLSVFGECVEKLTKISQQFINQSLMSDELASRISDLMIRLLRLKFSGYQQCFHDIVNDSPLSISEMVLVLAAQDQGKWKMGPSDKVDNPHQLISDGELVDSAIKTWTNRVRESIRKNTLFQEVHLFTILHCFAQFNNDYIEVHAAIDQMCKTKNGLTRFLKLFNQENIVLPNFKILIEDAEKLNQHILNFSITEKYEWLVTFLSQEENIESIKNQHNR